MSDISDLGSKGLPSTRSLLHATAAALVIAAATLTLFVLPAEYGIDPTGVGKRLGLADMSNGADDVEDVVIDAVAPDSSQLSAPMPPLATDTPSPVVPPISPLDAVWKSDIPYRSDEMTLTLKPAEGAEIKAMMRSGDRLFFSWTADGPVNFDMHGEELHSKADEYTSYWKGRGAQQGSGGFQAPFAGTHGWYWRNRGPAPVTVRVATSGFYEKLFKP